MSNYNVYQTQRPWKGEQLNIYQHTVSSWLTVTSSILALKWGVHGGSTTDCIGNPIVGDGKVKSMLGGGSWKKKMKKNMF